MSAVIMHDGLYRALLEDEPAWLGNAQRGTRHVGSLDT